jgi:hypothetical protein
MARKCQDRQGLRTRPVPAFGERRQSGTSGDVTQTGSIATVLDTLRRGGATMRVPRLAAAVITIALVLLATDTEGQHCLHGGNESPEKRLRRRATVGFVADVNGAHSQWHRETGKYASLGELRQSYGAPFGFVPGLVVDQFGYALKVTDALDPSSFSFFSDERGIIFEAHPVTVAERILLPIPQRK